MRRIIPISSGKGGVGKTTVAVNFSLALSRHGKTVLVDLDTGTSSVRNAIDTPVDRDLYHFFRKGEPLSRCVTTLSQKLDPNNEFGNFGFVAAPLHLIEEITNFGPERKAELIDGINSLDAEYIILDLKAGLDANVIDFLPVSNSGILVFTPHLPAATLAASDIVKAILFRKLRLIFGRNSPFFETLGGGIDQWRLINDLLDQVEDVYESSIRNLDVFVDDLWASLGDHPIARTVQQTLDEFRVYYILNLFSGVQESYDSAIRPFLTNLTENVTSRSNVTNLGWITRSEGIHQANVRRVPALLDHPETQPSAGKGERWALELEDLRATAIGIEPRRENAKPKQRSTARTAATDPLSQQLDVLKTMFQKRGDDDFRDNFEYAVQRALFTMSSRRASEFGQMQIWKPQEMLDAIYARSERGRKS